MIPKEETLLQELKSDANSDVAFSKLVRLYKERLYWHIRHIVKNHDDTDDVLQNVFIKVYRNINSFKGESKLYSWLYRIASNEAFTFLTQKARRTNSTDEVLRTRLIDNLEADPFYDGDAMQLKFQHAVATLPRKQQQVFQMKYFDNLKYREIAEILTTSEGALKASYHLAVKKIEAYIKNN